jgi:hypothetical protein
MAKKRNEKKSKQENLGKVIIPVGHPNPPEQHEEYVAKILANHFRTDVEFIVPIDDYKRKSADIMLFEKPWEIKSPKGSSKSTIENQFRRASKQAENLIIDTHRSKLKHEVIERRVLYEMKRHPSIKRVILIDNLKNVIEIKK